MSGESVHEWRQPVEFNCQPTDGLMGKWYAIQVRPRSEQYVAILLEAKGYRYYLPVWRAGDRCSGAASRVSSPLFPGYLFCRWETPFPQPIVATPGVIRILSAGRTPTPVAEDELTAVMTIVGSGRPARSLPGFQTGTRVEIRQGPLKGVQGILKSTKNGHRLIVAVTLLNRSVEVEVDGNCLTEAERP